MMDKNGNGYFAGEADRFIQVLRLYHAGKIRNIAVAAGSSSILRNERIEADFLKEELLAQGIPAENIIAEDRSRNTSENARYILHKLDSMKLPGPYVLVTSAMHMPRALAVFRKQGANVVPYPSSFKEVDYRKTFADYIIPDTGLLSQWSLFLKEMVGLTVYKLLGKA